MPKPQKGKKFAKIVKGKKISYGDVNYKIKPNSKAANSYCARSLAIEKANKAKGKGVTANTLSRRAWGCVGKKSKKK